jgi:hypothetical protein
MSNVEELREVDLRFDRENWLSGELEAALKELPTDRHRNTVIKLVEGRLTGRSDETTFAMEDVCAKKTWHGPYRDGVRHPGWKDDPLVQKAMTLAEEYLGQHAEATVLAQIKEAQRLLASAAIEAVMTLTNILNDEDAPHDVRRRAANDILDRVSQSFSRKTTSVVDQRSISFDLSALPKEVLAGLAGMPVPYGGEIVDAES